ncbi:uncharacterized protein LOC134687739 [Mytilus trossulus]|uniref:uncharacterized protein LOC134687739 n=1 Tax=Mytilus trossulus TaxID=6551 RepID=UPI0030056F7C
MKEISLILEEREDNEGDIAKFTKASETYFALLDGVTQRLDELKIFEEEIQDKITDIKKTESATDTNARTDSTVSTVTTPRITEEKSTFNRKLRQFFNTYITARDAAESQSKETHTGPSFEEKQQSKIQSNNSNFQPRKQLSAEALMTIKPFGKNSGSENSMVCRYCDGHHWSDECRKFSTIEDRKQKIKGSCYTCLKPGHVSRDCKFEKACYHCKQKKGHHRSLCPKKIPYQHKEVSHLADEMCEIASSEENVPENSLLSSGDIVLMQTAQTTVSNIEVNETEVVRLLMDSGSQRTYITENLAKRLNLKKKATEEITLVTFGADKPKTFRKQKVSLKIKLKDGVCMLIDANVVPKITGSILRTPLQMDVCENVKYLCNNLQLADTLPSCLESSTIEILIGNDYYLDIILPQKIEIREGLYLLGSKLGWILTGRSQLSDEERENKMTKPVNSLLSITEYCPYSTIDTCLKIKPLTEDSLNLENIETKEFQYPSDDENTFNNFVISLKMENGKILCNPPAKIRVVIIKDNLAHKSWKIGRKCQLIVSRDGQIRSGKVMLHNKKNLNRALNMLYPIECEELDEGLKNSDTEKDTELINDKTRTTPERTQRQAARTAMKKIQEQLES